jgi:hypothetical protein
MQNFWKNKTTIKQKIKIKIDCIPLEQVLLQLKQHFQ